MANFPKISFKNIEGWIPDTDVDGIDADSKYLSDIHAFRIYNGYMENNIGVEDVSLPSNVVSSISAGYIIKSACDFTHSIQGDKTFYILYKLTADSVDKIRMYVDNEVIQLGDGDTYSITSEPNNINYNLVNDELKINLNCTAEAYGKSVILNLSLQYLTERVYNSTNSVSRYAGWYICPRWLGWQYNIGEVNEDDDFIKQIDTGTVEDFEDTTYEYGGVSLNNWIRTTNFQHSGNYSIKNATISVNDDSEPQRYFTITVEEPGTLKMYMRACKTAAFDDDDYIENGDSYISIFSESSDKVYKLTRETGFDGDGWARYTCVIEETGTVPLRIIASPYGVGLSRNYVYYQYYIDDIEFLQLFESYQRRTVQKLAIIAKYFDGQRSLIQYGSSLYQFDFFLHRDIIDWRVEAYEMYAYDEDTDTYVLYSSINVNNNFGVYDTNYVTLSFSKNEDGTTLDFNYNLPFDSRVDNQSLIYAEVSHKGRVYFIKEDFKVYQSHIAGNGVLQPDSFPYDEDQGFGYFVVSRSRVNTMLAVSPTNDLVVFTNMGMYVYFIEPSGNTVYRYLKLVSGSVGISSRKSLAINKEGNPATQGLMWCDDNGIYYYPGGVTEPTNILLPAHTRYWENISTTYKLSAVGYYDATKYEYIIYLNQELIRFSLPYKSFVRSSFGGIDEVTGYKNNILRFRNGDVLYKFVSNVYANGYFITHYNSGIRDDRYGRTYDADEIDDKIMQELYVIFGKNTDKLAELTITVYIDDEIQIGSYKVYATDIYWKRLLPIRRFRKIKLKVEVTNSERVCINDIGISLVYDGLEAVGVPS